MQVFIHPTLLALLFVTSAPASAPSTTTAATTPSTSTPAATPTTATTTTTPSTATTTATPTTGTPATTPSTTSTTTTPSTVTTATTLSTVTTATTPTTVTTATTPSTMTTATNPSTSTPATNPSTVTTATTPSTTTTIATPSTVTTATNPSTVTTATTPSTATTIATPSTVTTATTPSTMTTATTPTTVTTATTPSTVTTATSPSTVTTTTTPTTVSTATTPSTVTTATIPSITNTTATPSTATPSTTPSTSTVTTASKITTSKSLLSTSNPSSGPAGPTSLCQNTSCESDSSCIVLRNSYFCLCSEGYYYNVSTCMEGKVFPGIIKVTESVTSQLGDKNSVAYENLHKKVIKFFQDAFSISTANADYGQTVIIKVSTSPSARSGMRADQAVDVSVANIFDKTTKKSEKDVSEIIQTALKDGASGIEGYTMQGRCDYYGCKNTTKDDCGSLQCECKDGFKRPNPQVPFCFALQANCPVDCTEKNNKQCLLKDDSGASECVCLPGYQDKDGTCETCPFGYSGANCEDQFQLILTIVGTIAGILILGLVIVLIVSSRSKKKKNIEEQNLIEEDFQNLRLTQTGFTNLGADGSIFPKVRTVASRDSQPQNPYVNPREW